MLKLLECICFECIVITEIRNRLFPQLICFVTATKAIATLQRILSDASRSQLCRNFKTLVMNKKTLYHFILDKSGSMSNCTRETIAGFNAQLDTIGALQSEFPNQEFAISLTIFDNFSDHLIRERQADEFSRLTLADYRPNGQTALLDAIGESVNSIRMGHESEILANTISVVVIILTDGQENASRRFTYHEIASTIAALEETGNWTFTFLGADMDAVHTSKMLNIRSENVVSFSKSDMHAMMFDVGEGMRHYSSAKESGNVKKDFLDFISKKDRRK